MMVKVRLLQPFSGAVGRPALEVRLPERATVGDLIEALSREHPRFREQAHEKDGRLSEYITFFVNDRPAASTGVELAEGDDILLFFPVSGG